MTDKVQKIGEEVVRLHNLLPTMDGDNISVNYADRICTTLEVYIASLQEEPVSEIDFEQELYKYFGQVKDFTLGMRIAKRFYEIGRNYQESVSEDLEQAIDTYLATYFGGEKEKQDWPFLKKMAIHFANLQKQQMMAKAVDADVVVDRIGEVTYLCPHTKATPYQKVKVIVIKED